MSERRAEEDTGTALHAVRRALRINLGIGRVTEFDYCRRAYLYTNSAFGTFQAVYLNSIHKSSLLVSYSRTKPKPSVLYMLIIVALSSAKYEVGQSA